MADRYQDRPFPADDDFHRGDDMHASAKGESDPLAELARLIGQTDPFASMGRANQPAQPRVEAHDHYDPPAAAGDELADEAEADAGVSAGRPPWMQRVARQEAPPPDYPSQDYPSEDYPSQDFPSAVHPLKRYAAAHPAPEPDYHEAPPFAAEADHEADPSRYDDALYGQLDADGQDPHAQTYSDDPYAYQDGYAEAAEEPLRKRRGGMITVAFVLALAVLGTGAAFAYRTYVGSPRSGEPPIIKAETGPTKIVPAPADASTKVPDRLATGDGTEKIVPREEAPVDVNAQPAPRMVFPPLNQNANPPTVASVTPNSPPPVNAGNGTLPNNEPRRIRTLAVRGDQPDGTAVPAAKPAAAARAGRNAPVPPAAANANASTANAPLSLSPQATQPAPAADARSRVAANTPAQTVPSGDGGGYLVQVSSQKNESDAKASYRVLQGKYPSVLGSQSVLVKRVDLGEKGIFYRAFAGPFGSVDQAAQVCSNLKAAGGPQCFVQRN